MWHSGRHPSRSILTLEGLAITITYEEHFGFGINSPDLHNHFLMRDAGFMKDRADAAEAHRSIKPNRRDLSVEINPSGAAFLRGSNGALQ
jgi:hypothetical protein